MTHALEVLSYIIAGCSLLCCVLTVLFGYLHARRKEPMPVEHVDFII